MKSLTQFVKEGIFEAACVKKNAKNKQTYKGCEIWQSDSGDWCVAVKGKPSWSPQFVGKTLEDAKKFAETRKYPDVQESKASRVNRMRAVSEAARKRGRVIRESAARKIKR